MGIPDFLKRENHKQIDSAAIEFGRLLKEYEEKFGEGLTTEPSCWSDEEWIKILKNCIEQNIDFYELTGEPRELEEGTYF